MKKLDDNQRERDLAELRRLVKSIEKIGLMQRLVVASESRKRVEILLKYIEGVARISDKFLSTAVDLARKREKEEFAKLEKLHEHAKSNDPRAIEYFEHVDACEQFIDDPETVHKLCEHFRSLKWNKEARKKRQQRQAKKAKSK